MEIHACLGKFVGTLLPCGETAISCGQEKGTKFKIRETRKNRSTYEETELEPMDFLSENRLTECAMQAPESMMNSEENHDELLSAVLTLPETLRQPMYLYYYEDFNTLEIAEVLQIEPENVRNRMSRARKKLKMMLGKKLGAIRDGRVRARKAPHPSP
ncbi:RNA polymerase sigma factor [Paenibacillus sp. 843]|uniref:RNA polymerase sigma factor n=1 Tax=Paenibacillus sp. 843 TaxID=3341795 RepID=UPI00372B1B00